MATKIDGLKEAFANIKRKAVKDAGQKLAPEMEKIEATYKKGIRDGVNPKTGRAYRRLESDTIKRRRRLATVNQTHPAYSPNKSNVTFSGKLVDSIRFRLSLRPLLQIIIDVTGNHPRYRGITGGKIGKLTSNAQIAEGQAENGRPILSPSKKLIDNIRKAYERALRKVL